MRRSDPTFMTAIHTCFVCDASLTDGLDAICLKLSLINRVRTTNSILANKDAWRVGTTLLLGQEPDFLHTLLSLLRRLRRLLSSLLGKARRWLGRRITDPCRIWIADEPAVLRLVRTKLHECHLGPKGAVGGRAGLGTHDVLTESSCQPAGLGDGVSRICSAVYAELLQQMAVLAPFRAPR